MKHLLLFCGALLSVPLMGMELLKKEDADAGRTLWPRHLTPLIIEEIFKLPEHSYIECLACVNKELSEDVPYEVVRLTWELHGFKSPLSLIIEHRNDLFFQGDTQSIRLQRDRYLTVAKRFLENKADPNLLTLETRVLSNKATLLQQAAYLQDKELCKIFLEHGGDPLITTVRWEPQGPGYLWTAFDYSYKCHEYGEGDDQPRGWLKNLWDEIQSSFAKASADAAANK